MKWDFPQKSGIPRKQINFVAVVLGCLCLGSLTWFYFQWSAAADCLAKVSKNQGVRIVWREALSGDYAGKPVRWRTLIEYRPHFLEEMSVYPLGTLKRLNVKAMVLVEGLKQYGEIVGGIGMKRKYGSVLFLDVYRSPDLGYDCRAQALHHEMFHMFDKWGWQKDREWSKGSRYKYSQQGDGPAWDAPWQVPGFVSNYSRTFPGEDKAEVFSNLIIRYQVVMERCAKDPLLAFKVRLMKRRLEALGVGFDEGFWDRMAERPLAGGEATAAFWEEHRRLEPPHPPLPSLDMSASGDDLPYDRERGLKILAEQAKEFQPPAAPLEQR